MRISAILAHPNTESFNAALAKVAVETLKAGGYNLCQQILRVQYARVEDTRKF